MAASSSSSRFAGHGRRCRLLAVVFLAAFGFEAAAAAAAAASAGSERVILRVESLLTTASSSTAAAACHATREHKNVTESGTRMKLVHQHGPCSPLGGAHGKPSPSHEEILGADQSRVESIQRRVTASTGRGKPYKRATAAPAIRPTLSSTSPATSTLQSSSSSAALPATSGRAVGTGNYVVSIGLGTPAARYTVVFDTGSDTTWVQCQPCVVVCYKQKEKLFDPAKSATYANVSCADSFCSDLDTSGCNAGHCLYAVQYGDGSYTVGFFAQDTLTLAADHDAFKGFRFGCGERNRGLFGQAAGLLGLGRGKTSLPVQAYGKYGGVFAYCLPATSAGTGYLDLGPGSPAAAAAAANARLTPMLTENGPTFYYVGMTGIRVGGQQLAIPESVFSTAGTLVDSGTVITRLPPAAYAALRSAFGKAMAAHGYKKAPALSILDTCYDFSGVAGDVALPAVSLVFQGGACLDVDASGIMYAASLSQVCLGFAPNGDDGDVGIVGNTQQKTYGVLYDLGKKVVGFAPGAC